MKYIVFYTWKEDEESMKNLIKKWREIDVLRKEYPRSPELQKKYPGGFPQGLQLSQSPNGESNCAWCESPPGGFGIYEGTEQQYENWKKYYCPELTVTAPVIPKRACIFYISDYVIEYLLEPAKHEVICSRLKRRALVAQKEEP